MTRPTARVLALLEILQLGGTRTAAELADRLGVDERTARRYVEHLADLGVPVSSVRGRHGGFRLAPGYRMPPLMLTDEEALAVVVGLMTAERSGSGPSAAAARSASTKVRRVLPQRLRRRLDALLETAGFAGPRRLQAPPEADVLLLFAEAARERRAVAISYRSGGGRPSERTVHPYGVVAHDGRWYVTGADSASGEDRTFRLDRVQAASLSAETFTVPDDDRDPAERLRLALATAPRRHAVQVLVRARPEHLDRRLPSGLAVVEPHTSTGDDPWFRLRLQVEELDWVPSLLAWIDRPFVVEEPAVLRDHVRALAERLTRHAAASSDLAEPPVR